MKFTVVLDQGVTIGEKRYAHSMVVDSEKLRDDPMWSQDPEKKKVQEEEHRVRLAAAKTQLEKAKAEGLIVPEVIETKAVEPAGKEK